MNNLSNEQAQMFKTIDAGFTDILYGQVHLQYKKITEEGAEYIAKKKFERIKRVDLSRCELTDIGISFIATSKWNSIACVNLSNNNLTNRACKHLSKAQWPTLQELDIGGNNIEDAGLMHLTKANFKSLKAIDIYNIKYVKGIKILSKADWQTLESFYGYCNRSNELQSINVFLCQWNSLHTIQIKPYRHLKQQLKRQERLIAQRFKLLRYVNYR